jgi:hypothetical protein
MDEPATVDELYSHAIEPGAPYHTNPQLASSLLLNAIEILGSTNLSDAWRLKMVIAYIHFDAYSDTCTSLPINRITTAFKPHYTMSIIHILQKAIEVDVDIYGERMTQAEEAVLEHSKIIISWLWRASQSGIQSDFVQSTVCHFQRLPNSDIIVVAFRVS